MYDTVHAYLKVRLTLAIRTCLSVVSAMFSAVPHLDFRLGA
jgi:hypothetical protein